MLQFATLFKSLSSIKEGPSRAALVQTYLSELPDTEKQVAISILLNHKKHTLISMSALVALAQDYKNYPPWLLKRSNETVKDWSETISLIVARPDQPVLDDINLSDLIKQIDALKNAKNNDAAISSYILRQWQNLPADQLYIIHKIITGTWKAMFTPWEISELLAATYDGDIALIGMRLNDYLDDQYTFEEMINPTWTKAESKFRPPDFIFPMIPDTPLTILGHPAQWIIEPFVHGLRVQIHKLHHQIMIWAESQYWIEAKDHAFLKLLSTLPGHCVLEAIVAPTQDKNKKADRQIDPEDLILVDILRWDNIHQDNLGELLTRKTVLHQWLSENKFALPTIIPHQIIDSWDLLKSTPLSPGHMVKHGLHALNSPLWYRLKPHPVEILTALMYAELPNQMLEANYELTLGLKDTEDNLLPVAKIPSTLLSETTKTSLYYWIQNNTVKRFGPVRLLRIGQVFSISFERVELNKKVKAGLKLVHVKVLDNFQSPDLKTVDKMDVFEGLTVK